MNVSSQILLLDVKAVQDSMKHRGQQDPRGGDENDAGKEGVGRGEKLRRVRRERSHRAHSGKNHRGIEDRVDPGEAGDKMISTHTETE